MSDRFKYITHEGTVIYLDRLPYLLDSAKSSLSYSHNPTLAYGRIVGFANEYKTLPLTISVVSTAAQMLTHKEALYAAFESDVIAKMPGKFYVHGYQLECYVIAEDVTDRYKTASISNFTIAADEFSTWRKETVTQLFSSASAGEGDSFPHGFPHGFPNPNTEQAIINTASAPSEFRLVINGACTNPTITIAGHVYNVDVTLAEGERLIIDSAAKTIIKIDAVGVETNCFSLRNKDADKKPFVKIPAGESVVSWSGDYTFMLTLIDERSAPPWS